jgi:hypothetical protein
VVIGAVMLIGLEMEPKGNIAFSPPPFQTIA